MYVIYGMSQQPYHSPKPGNLNHYIILDYLHKPCGLYHKAAQALRRKPAPAHRCIRDIRAATIPF
jgi:hypothetical protein